MWRWRKTTIYTKSRKIPETNSSVTPTRNRLESVEMSHRRLPGRRFNLSLPRHNSLGTARPANVWEARKYSRGWISEWWRNGGKRVSQMYRRNKLWDFYKYNLAYRRGGSSHSSCHRPFWASVAKPRILTTTPLLAHDGHFYQLIM